jgi:O-antigen/teichoic acid export membrane protein
MIKNKYEQHRETINNFIWRAFQIVGKQGTVFFIFFISATYLSTESFGMLNYLMAIVALFMIFCDFGLSSAISKYSAEYNNKKEVTNLLKSSLIVSLALSFFIGIIIILFGKIITGDNMLFYFIPYAFFYPITSIFDGYYRGIKKFKNMSIITIITGIVTIVSSFILIQKYLFLGAIISHNLFFILLTVSFFIISRKIKAKFNKKIIKKIINYGFVIGLINVLYFLYTKADIIILKYFGYIIEIGYYEIVNTIFAILIIPFIIIGQVMAPNITKLYMNKQYKEVKNKFWKYIGFFFTISVILGISVYFIFPIFIKLFLLKYFTKDTILIFKLLLILLPLKIMAVIINHAHTIPTGNAKLSMWTMIPASIANIILDLIFISKYGFIGVIYSTIICFSFATISFIYLYYLKLNKLIKNEK